MANRNRNLDQNARDKDENPAPNPKPNREGTQMNAVPESERDDERPDRPQTFAERNPGLVPPPTEAPARSHTDISMSASTPPAASDYEAKHPWPQEPLTGAPQETELQARAHGRPSPDEKPQDHNQTAGAPVQTDERGEGTMESQPTIEQGGHNE